jgi:bacterioferritin-associated ferredoxin
MGRKRAVATSILDEATQQEIYTAIAELKTLVGQMDQWEACGQDCSEFRTLAQHYLDQLTATVNHVILNQPVAAQPAAS